MTTERRVQIRERLKRSTPVPDRDENEDTEETLPFDKDEVTDVIDIVTEEYKNCAEENLAKMRRSVDALKEMKK